ncbi:hypothetical protein PPYR_15573 [Photinus pyralis]|uniref:DUF4806 domain-containing protein n=1 Tax=Photinus pyralis TaxID=7054 RepID=A0A5N3ZYG0_PHOPY|nr:hypothetical protein PPYR_15573 [Photinus pyralis]
MSYAVVTFTNSSDHPDENDYCTSEIPMSWLCNNNTKCWWPTSNKNVGSLISKGAPPNTEKWSVEDVVVEQTGVSLEKGRKIANDLDYASSDDASKGRGKRKIINPRKSTSDEECNTNISSKNWRKLTNIALPPQLPGSKVDNYVLPISPMIAEEAGVSGDQENEIQCMPIILASENQIQSMPIILSDEQNLFLENNEVRGSDAHVEEQFIDLDLSIQHSQSTMSRTQNVIEDPNTISDYIGSSNANIGEHLTKITRMFVSINMALKSIDQRLGRLETGPEGAVCDNEGLELIKGSLPLNDIEAITAFDNLLSNKEVSKQFMWFAQVFPLRKMNSSKCVVNGYVLRNRGSTVKSNLYIFWKFVLLPTTFDFVLNQIGDSLVRKTLDGNPMVSPAKQLQIALWRLATPDSYRSICLRFHVGQATAIRSVRRVVRELIVRLDNFIVWPTGRAAINITKRFRKTSAFPGIVGAIDGTHIRIPAPLERYVITRDCSLIVMWEMSDRYVFRRSALADYINNERYFAEGTHLVGFQIKLFKQLKFLQEQNTQILAILKNQSSVNIPALNSLPENLPCDFPLKSLDNVKDFEAYLQDNQNFMHMVSYFASIGGKDLTVQVNNILRRLICNELARQFSFYGKRGGKKSFGSLKIKELIIDGCIDDNLYSSSNDTDLSDKIINENVKNLSSELKHWVLSHNIPRIAVTNLLHVLHPHHPELPLDYRTFLKTPLTIKTKKLDNGEYAHFGFSDALHHYLSTTNMLGNTILLSFNIDGIPLFKSTQISFWPILASIKNMESTPFVVGVFCGTGKPSPLSLYLEDFLNELQFLMENGFDFKHTLYKVDVHSFICDAPARAYLKCVKGHNGYSCCDKCEVRGKHFPGRMVLNDISAPIRTDVSFLQQSDTEHHTGTSPLTKLGMGLVTSFPIDYMHCVCLGVVRKLLCTWSEGPRSLTKLSNNSIKTISEHLLLLRRHIPTEFNRKPRSLSELPRWKATEFRTLLLYLGPVVLKQSMKKALFENFLRLHTAITIFTSSTHIQHLKTEIAGEFLKVFVQHCRRIYGEEYTVYNIHMLVHLKEDVDRYGPLDNISEFPFETFLNRLKRLIRSPKQPLQQIGKRLKEINYFNRNPISPIEFECILEPTNGPLSKDMNFTNTHLQFKKVSLTNFLLCILSYSQADADCMLKNKKVVQIHNILKTAQNEIFLFCKRFLCYNSFYSYPIRSSELNIYTTKNLSNEWEIVSVADVAAKCLVLPLNDSEHVSFPLVHSL